MDRTAASAEPRDPGLALAASILAAISFCHLFNDMNQSLINALYPMFKQNLGLSFAQLGLVSFTYQLTASLLQPLVGLSTDRHPRPFSLVAGMGCSLLGLLLFSVAARFGVLLAAAVMVGMGSSVFHPEASRVAQLASGGRRGLAQSVFQVGGNVGQSLGPLLAALVVMPRGQYAISWLTVTALLAMVIMTRVGLWYRDHLQARLRAGARTAAPPLPRGKVVLAMGILGLLMFSKYFYLASISNYYTFYLMDKFHLGIRSAQLYLFLYLGAAAAGTVLGGPIGDRIGRKRVIWASILGGAAVQPGPALRQPALDRRPHRAHRPGAVLGLLGHPGLRPGTGAGADRPDRGAVLRPGVRPGRHRRGPAGRPGRPRGHPLRLPGLLVPAVPGHFHGLPAGTESS